MRKKRFIIINVKIVICKISATKPVDSKRLGDEPGPACLSAQCSAVGEGRERSEGRGKERRWEGLAHRGVSLGVYVADGAEAHGVLAALARVGLASDAVHGDGQDLVCLSGQRPQRHAASAEPGEG